MTSAIKNKNYNGKASSALASAVNYTGKHDATIGRISLMTLES